MARHVDLGYATTAHRAQGRTVDTAHAYVTATTLREPLYVMATRGREANRLYVDTTYDPDAATSHTDPDHRTPADVLRARPGRHRRRPLRTPHPRRSRQPPHRPAAGPSATDSTTTGSPGLGPRPPPRRRGGRNHRHGISDHSHGDPAAEASARLAAVRCIGGKSRLCSGPSARLAQRPLSRGAWFS